ncbi:hypothetical protein D9M71_821500 [compost metagenome]
MARPSANRTDGVETRRTEAQLVFMADAISYQAGFEVRHPRLVALEPLNRVPVDRGGIRIGLQQWFEGCLK